MSEREQVLGRKAGAVAIIGRTKYLQVLDVAMRTLDLQHGNVESEIPVTT